MQKTLAFIMGAMVLATACGTRVEVRPDQLPELIPKIGALDPGEAVTVIDARSGNPFEVTVENDPAWNLTLDRSCSFWQYLASTCDRIVSSPAPLTSLAGERLTLHWKTCAFCSREPLEATLPEVTGASLQLAGVDAPGWRPFFGVGFAVAGPTGVAAFGVQLLPWDWLGIELGAIPAPDIGLIYAAFRLRPVALGPLKPFAGAFVQYLGGCDPAGDLGCTHKAATGGRLGLDLELWRGHLLLTLEANLVRPLQEDRTFYLAFEEHGGAWLGYWGGSVWFFI